jgi:hypothetical protein
LARTEALGLCDKLCPCAELNPRAGLIPKSSRMVEVCGHHPLPSACAVRLSSLSSLSDTHTHSLIFRYSPLSHSLSICTDARTHPTRVPSSHAGLNCPPPPHPPPPAAWTSRTPSRTARAPSSTRTRSLPPQTPSHRPPPAPPKGPRVDLGLPLLSGVSPPGPAHGPISPPSHTYALPPSSSPWSLLPSPIYCRDCTSPTRSSLPPISASSFCGPPLTPPPAFAEVPHGAVPGRLPRGHPARRRCDPPPAAAAAAPPRTLPPSAARARSLA